jgi:hypothetical protein
MGGGGNVYLIPLKIKNFLGGACGGAPLSTGPAAPERGGLSQKRHTKATMKQRTNVHSQTI